MIFKYFRQKIGEKIVVFDSKQSQNLKKIGHNIGFREKRKIFRRKLAKIAENCDHNIGPWRMTRQHELRKRPGQKRRFLRHNSNKRR
jgi:hypothetical protein